jgi:ABC-type multidrug transport system ATPase subunit
MATNTVTEASSSQAPSTNAGKRIALTVAGLSKRFAVRRGWRESLRHPRSHRTTLALDDVSFEVAAGEFFGLLGPNGAGKTTLFKMLATLVLPDAGTATVEGADVVRDAPRVRRLLTPVIADERSLQWRLTARENMELFAVLQDVPRAEQDTRIDALLGEVGLGETGSKMVGAFSSGMRQRLLIARALLARPRVLLLDEPTRSLDPISARDFRRFLREEIAGRHGCTILLATHSADEAFELCDRVAVLDRGRLLAVGRARTLAAEFGDERHRLWTTAPRHSAFAELEREGRISHVQLLDAVERDTEREWQCLEVVVHGGVGASAGIVAALAAAGVPIGRLERVPLSLADLLERVVASRGVSARKEARDA